MDKRITRRDFFKVLGAAATILAFSGLGLTKVIGFANGASITTSTVSRSVTTNTKFKVGTDVGVFGGRYG